MEPTTIESEQATQFTLLVERIWKEYSYEWLATVKRGSIEVYRSELHRIKDNATRDGLRWLLAQVGR